MPLRVRSSIRECLRCGSRTTNLGRISRYSQTKESDSSDSSFLLWKDWFRHFGNYLHARRLEILRDLIRTRDGSSALDVGCAAGILKAMGLSGVLGIDIVSSPAVVVLASGEYLPFRDGSFRLVFAGEVIEHLREPLRALKEWVRVLKDGGRIVISTPNGLHVSIHGGNPEHRRMFAPNDLCRTLQRLGVDVIYARGIFTSLIPGRRLFRRMPFDSVKMAILRLPVPLSLSYDVFIAAEKRSRN